MEKISFKNYLDVFEKCIVNRNIGPDRRHWEKHFLRTYKELAADWSKFTDYKKLIDASETERLEMLIKEKNLLFYKVAQLYFFAMIGMEPDKSEYYKNELESVLQFYEYENCLVKKPKSK